LEGKDTRYPVARIDAENFIIRAEDYVVLHMGMVATDLDVPGGGMDRSGEGVGVV
jgi:hypothetical protein